MTNSLRRVTPPVEETYDDHDRWLDDRDGGDRWRSYAACRDEDPALFFPLVVERRRVVDPMGDVSYEDVVTDEEPPYPPPNVKAICDRCTVAGKCLDKFMDEDQGIFGGTTGYQRQLLTKKVKPRKRCAVCTSPDVVVNNNQKKEACLACGHSWDVL